MIKELIKKCILCKHNKFALISKQVRDSKKHKIIRCLKCNHIQLWPIPTLNDEKKFYDENLQEKNINDVGSIKRARRKIKIDKKTLMKRAKKAARSKLAKKRLKGAKLSDLGLGQKIALSKFLDKKSGKIAKIAKRLVKGIRQKEMQKKRKPIDKANKSGIPIKKKA